MVVDMSVTTSTTKLPMRGNISKVRGVREAGTYRRKDKSPSPQQSVCTEVGAVDNSLSLPLDSSEYVKLTPFEKPLFESAIMSGKTMKEALTFARKTLFMKMRERTSEKTTCNTASGDFKQPRSKDDSPKNVHPVHKQTSKVVGGTVNLSLVPFDVKNAPLTFTQMEQIHATIIDMVIEHNHRDINPESLNCQFKTGWMAFKCSTATAEWLKLNCNDISKKCKLSLNVVEEINQDEKNLKQNQTKSTRSPRLKRRYYLALHHLKELKKAKESGVPVNNAKLIRIKYESMVEDYLNTQKNERRLRKLLVREGVLDRPKKARPLHKRYRLALHCLDKLKKMEESGTPLDENKLMSRRRLQAVVDEYLKEQAENNNSTGKNPNNVRPFHEVITDPLCVAVGGKRKGLFVPIPTEWPSIQLQINELVTSYVLENQDDSPVPRYDLNEVHRGFRVIKCMDEFSKKFLFKCIASLKDIWKELNLMIIPASQIPKGRRDPIDLKAEAALKKINQNTNIGSSKSAKTIPPVSFSTSDENMDFQTPLKYNEAEKTAALQDHENQHPRTFNLFRSLDFQTPPHHDLTKKTITSNIRCMDKTENSPRDLPIKQYLAQQPQTSRKAAEFSLQNRFNPLRSSDFKTQLSNETSRRNKERKLTQNQTITKSEDWGKTCDVTDNSCSNKIQFHQASPPTCNVTLRRSSERSDAQSHILMNSGDWQRSPDFYANSGSNRSQFYQDSLPDCSNPYNIDRFSASSRRSSERNSVQTHTLNNSDDWRRSPNSYENSRLNVTKLYQDSPPQCSNAYRNEISMRSRERIPVQGQTLANSESRPRSSVTTMSPDFHAKLTQSYEDFPPHYSNPYRNLSSSDSFNNRYHKPDSFDILSTEAAKYNVRGKEAYRSNEFHDASQHRDFESFPNYFSQPDSRINNSYSRIEKNYLPRGDDDIPPPPPRWN